MSITQVAGIIQNGLAAPGSDEWSFCSFEGILTLEMRNNERFLTSRQARHLVSPAWHCWGRVCHGSLVSAHTRFDSRETTRTCRHKDTRFVSFGFIRAKDDKLNSFSTNTNRYGIPAAHSIAGEYLEP